MKGETHRHIRTVGYPLGPFRAFLFVFCGWRPKSWEYRRSTRFYDYYYDKETRRNFIVDRINKRPMEISLK